MNNAKITVHLVENLHSQGVIAPFGHVAPPVLPRSEHVSSECPMRVKKNKCNLRTFVVISFA